MYWSILKLIWHSSSLRSENLYLLINHYLVSVRTSIVLNPPMELDIWAARRGVLWQFWPSAGLPLQHLNSNKHMMYKSLYIWNLMMGWESTPLCCKVRPFQNNQVFDMKTKFFGKAYRFGGLWRMQVYIYIIYIHTWWPCNPNQILRTIWNTISAGWN